MSPRAPSWMGVGVHSPSRPSPESPVRRASWARAAVGATVATTPGGHDSDGDEGEDEDGDGDYATTEMTDTTDATSTSQGSLTSVD